MSTKSSKKKTDKNKQQTKAIKKAIKKAVKQRLKNAKKNQLSVKTLSDVEISTLANNIAIQIIPDIESVTIVPASKKVKKLQTKPNAMSFALTPYKKHPCKQCPAKSGGLCACAIKANKQKAS